VAFGRFGETAMWILVALASGPMRAAGLLDEVRRLDGHVGPGGLFAAVARLERRGLIQPIMTSDGRRAYRLSSRGHADLVAQTEGV
jgi:DNA-binding PadR family transcriptional regulator